MRIFSLCISLFFLFIALVSSSNANGAWSEIFFERKEFLFAFDKKECRLSVNGTGLCKDSGGETVEFNLPLDESDYVFNLEVLNYLGKLCLVYEFHNDESGAGAAVLLDSKSFRTVWVVQIPGFNIGEGLISGNFLYVTAGGFIGKINLDTGNYEWQHEELSRPPDLFNSFKRPVLQDDGYVHFVEGEPFYYKRRLPVTLKVYDLTGDILWDNDMYDTGQCKHCEDCCEKKGE